MKAWKFHLERETLVLKAPQTAPGSAKSV